MSVLHSNDYPDSENYFWMRYSILCNSTVSFFFFKEQSLKRSHVRRSYFTALEVNRRQSGDSSSLPPAPITLLYK